MRSRHWIILWGLKLTLHKTCPPFRVCLHINWLLFSRWCLTVWQDVWITWLQSNRRLFVFSALEGISGLWEEQKCSFGTWSSIYNKAAYVDRIGPSVGITENLASGILGVGRAETEHRRVRKGKHLAHQHRCQEVLGWSYTYSLSIYPRKAG